MNHLPTIIRKQQQHIKGMSISKRRSVQNYQGNDPRPSLSKNKRDSNRKVFNQKSMIYDRNDKDNDTTRTQKPQVNIKFNSNVKMLKKSDFMTMINDSLNKIPIKNFAAGIWSQMKDDLSGLDKV